MKKILTLLLLAAQISTGQPAPSLEKKLVLTCRVWGFLKLFHDGPSYCKLNWDQVMLNNIAAAKSASSHAAFNSVLQNIIAAAGTMSMPATPNPVIAPGQNTNLDLSWFSDPDLSPAVKDQLDTVMRRFRPHNICTVMPNGLVIKFTDDTVGFNYNSPQYNQRMLAVFRYWNYINYFFNSISLADEPWASTLGRVVLMVDTAVGELSYHKAILELVAGIGDTHTGHVSTGQFNQFIGTYRPCFSCVMASGKVTVKKVFGSASGKINPGDVIEEIDGTPIDTLMKRRSRYIAFSNSNVLNRDLLLAQKNIFLGTYASLAVFKVTGISGSYTTSIARDCASGQFSDSALVYYGPPYADMDRPGCTIGYVHMGKLQPADIAPMYQSFKDKDAIIFDIRNYPNATAWAISAKMAAATYTYAHLIYPSLTFPGVVSFTNMTSITPDLLYPYKGDVYVIVDAMTQSQAEYSAMMFQGMGSKVKVIGSQTAGADGNITNIKVLKYTSSTFSTLQVRYPDNYIAQRVGVRIDYTVTPTIPGIRNKKDELLDFALSLSGCLPVNMEETGQPAFVVFPNPASDQVRISNVSSPGQLDLLDSSGRMVRTWAEQQGQKNENDYSYPVYDLAEGFYLLRLNGKFHKLVISR